MMFYLILVSLIWAFSFGLIGNTLAGLPYAWIGMVRLGIASAVFLPFVRRVEPRLGVKLFFIGMVQFGLMYLFYNASFRHLESYEVALFTALTPVYMVMLNDVFFKRSFSPVYWGAAVLAVLGGGVLHWKGTFDTTAWTGFWLVQGSNVCFAVGQLLYRSVMGNAEIVGADPRVRPGRHMGLPLRRVGSPSAFQPSAFSLLRADASVFFWLYLGAVAAVIPFAVGNMPEAVTPVQWRALVYLGAIASGASFFLWNLGARKTNAGTLAVMNNLKIPLTVIVSIAVFNESIQWYILAAGIVLFLFACVLPRLSAILLTALRS